MATFKTSDIRQAIVTKYAGPTNTKGSRIIASSFAGRTITAFRSELNTEENHAAAAKAHAEKWGWNGDYQGGGMPKGSGYVWVCMGK